MSKSFKSNMLLEASTFEHYVPVNDGNPVQKIGASTTELLTVQAMYASGTQTLDYVKFQTSTASSLTNAGSYKYYVDDLLVFVIQDNGIGTSGIQCSELIVSGVMSNSVFQADNNTVNIGNWVDGLPASGYLMNVYGNFRVSDGTSATTSAFTVDSSTGTGQFFGDLVVGVDFQCNQDASIVGHLGVNNLLPTYSLDVNGSARIGSNSLTPPSNGLVIGGNLNVGDVSTDADISINMYRTLWTWNTSTKQSILQFTGDGSGNGGGYPAVSLQSLWADIAFDFYATIATENQYAPCHQFFINKSVLMMPNSNLYDASLVGGTEGFGTNGLYTTEYASFYPWIDETNNVLNLTAMTSAGDLRYASIPLNALSNYPSESVPVIITDVTYTANIYQRNIVMNGAACVVTLPAAASYPGLDFTILLTGAGAITSASANVVPLTGSDGGPGTAIITTVTDGIWVTMVSDGTNWTVMRGNQPI